MSCDGTCQHVEKMCDHITDCKDGADEMIDFSDELNCKKTPQKCPDDKHFECTDKKKKICLTQVCDSKYDCDDQSDEIHECLDHFTENKIQIQVLRQGVAIIKWSPQGAPNKPLDITIKSFPENTKIFEQKAFKGSQIEVSGHKLCSRYILKILDQDSDEVKHQHYTYKETDMKSPKNVQYFGGQSRISWECEIPECSSKAYYIECYDGNNRVIKDFAAEESYNFSPFRITHCRISTCPSTTFNISCSAFTEISTRVSPSILTIVLIVLAVVFLVVLLIICFKITSKKQRFQRYLKRCCGACLSRRAFSSRK
ncbi:hypothetical protein RF11_10548 [Thelohanellus kitauei]|uniref:Very low-density lipoprotein receptor n=1 Tax=Thelohanellus kitauei TaxID=669202 RepID=A0A0C2M722_THEKT|nr:hypothetical protein RF11_10548 [Thelohanellus kitauei]